MNRMTGGLIGGKNVDVVSHKAAMTGGLVAGMAGGALGAHLGGANTEDLAVFAAAGGIGGSLGGLHGGVMRRGMAKVAGKKTNTVSWTGRPNHKSK
jgi:hypothetical protein